MLTSLAPCSYWEFSLSLLKLNVKRAPEMSTLIGLQWLLNNRYLNICLFELIFYWNFILQKSAQDGVFISLLVNVSKFQFFLIGILFGWNFEFSDTWLLALSGFVDKVVHTMAQCSQFILLIIHFMFVVNSLRFQVNQP